MIKLLVKIFSILLVTAILIIIYFSLVGLKTEKFNEVITKQLLKNNSKLISLWKKILVISIDHSYINSKNR